MRGSTVNGLTRTLAAVLAAVMLALPLAGCGLVGSEEAAVESPATGAMPPVGDATVTREYYGLKDGEVAQSEPMPPPGSGTDASIVPQEDRLVILSQSLRMEVEAVEDAVKRIRELTAKHKGTVTGMQVSTDVDVPIYRYDESGGSDGTPLLAYVTVRVPNASLQAFVDETSALGKVLRQSQDSQDVTQEHVDLAARLANLRAQEKRLREFFDSAKKVSEMLEIERELARVRGEIESIDAQKKYLERQAAMATVTFELVEPKPLVRPAGENWGFGDSITRSIRAFVGTVNTLVVLLGPIVAIAIFVVLPAGLLVRWLVRRTRQRRETASGQESGD